ncbi:jg22759 [Pararge aegeria aegeria]|uniref:Jg22759 protein n=1 Tax=Pararge aegeria aegeria TaxID=348720 RepID=A0A8S4R0S6_9NEOP|nr:jg22759 [Pararge aegeria aegeria]
MTSDESLGAAGGSDSLDVIRLPPTRWTDDIRRVAGSCWRQASQDRGLWNSLQKTYVKLWTSMVELIRWMMMIGLISPPHRVANTRYWMFRIHQTN